MLEKTLEKKLVKAVENINGWAIKLPAVYVSGIPDRLVLLPKGVLFFVEMKRKGERPRKLQTIVHNRLERLGFKVYVIDTEQQINEVLNEYTVKNR